MTLNVSKSWMVLMAVFTLFAGSAYLPTFDARESANEAPRVDGEVPERDTAWIPAIADRMQSRPNRAAPVAARHPLEGYRLIGSIESDGEDLALISGNGPVQSLHIGDALNGFTLISVAPDHVVLERDGEAVTLRNTP